MRNAATDWGKADWKDQDVAISRELGISRERVRQKRLELGIGKPEGHRQRESEVAAKILGMKTGGMTIPKVALACGCSEEYAGTVMRGAGKDYVRRPKGGAKYDWASVKPSEWERMTDKEVAKLVGASKPIVVTQWRLRHGVRSASTGRGLGAGKGRKW